MKYVKNSSVFSGCIYTIIIYFLVAIALRFIGDEQLKYQYLTTPMVENEDVIGEIIDGIIIEQSFVAETDIIDSMTFMVATYARINTGELIVKLYDNESGFVLSESHIDISEFIDNSNYTVEFDKRITGVKGKKLSIQLTAPKSASGNATTIYYNSNINGENRELKVNQEIIQGELCFSVNGLELNSFGNYYWLYTAIGAVILSAYCANVIYKDNLGKKSLFIGFYDVYIKYKFLIKQLVSRDFKTKYKRSVLGFMWSFLNPLLTMCIQYIVFSTIFKSNIDNFPVYLLSGSIIFNFFTESVGVGLVSIINNSSLITKVYVPKYIYPITRVLSTAINLLLSLIPLLIAILVTGEQITKAYLLLPFVIICLIIFCIGMSFILSSAMVFFRDTQFLWGIVSLLWMYATPLFYPENIIPDKYAFILKVNPMYYFIKFTRIILMDGVSPQPIYYLQCIISALSVFIIGSLIFKRTQDKFVLYI